MKQFRHIKGERQSDTAEAVGVSREMYSMYESGKVKAPLKVLTRVADHFEVSVDMLFGRNMQGLDFLKWTDVKEELELLKKFDTLPEAEREAIMAQIDELAGGGRM